MKDNKTFGPSENYNHNALVGEDTYGDKDFAYEWGFASSVDLLLTLSLTYEYLEDPDTGKAINILKDTLIYPILFCARHHIELHLKLHISRIASLRSVKVEDNTSTHNLGFLYETLVNLSNATDHRLLVYVEMLHEFILDYDSIDETGQTFRYAQDNEKKAHLPGQHFIDLSNVKVRWNEMRDAMENLSIFVNDVLSPEYATGTFTDKFNRQELFELAHALPIYMEWGRKSKEYFLDVKKNCLGRKNISGRDFTKAIDKIKSTHCLSALIGVELTLDGLPQDIVVRMLKVKVSGSVQIIDRLEWHAISAVFECSSHIYFPEDYFLSMAAAKNNVEAYIDPAHVMRKICWDPQRFAEGLRSQGQTSLASCFSEHIDEFYVPKDIPQNRSTSAENFFGRFRNSEDES